MKISPKTNFNLEIFFSALVQKRLRREKRTRRRLQEQLETEAKRRAQLEDALKATGAVDQLRIINGTYKKYAPNTQRSIAQ